ncbi:hypothetical protein BGY98DRAFT_1099804 [Russula aff. rugulosa BPL654]|nr:hypothetical protein BGY98DRAFT_1099804 [Russula aff. rugulosa BPL654]
MSLPAPTAVNVPHLANAHLVWPPRHNQPPPLPALTLTPPASVVLAALSQFPPAPQRFQLAQQGAASLASSLPSQCSALFVSSPRRDLLHLTVAPAPSLAIKTPPRAAEAFLQARTTLSPAPAPALSERVGTT